MAEAANDQRMTGEYIGALNHEIRREALRLLHGSDGEMSGTQMSRFIRALPSLLSYHLGVLTKNGAIILVSERPVRGLKEKLFRSQVANHSQILRILEDTEDDDSDARRRPSSTQ